jgi:hypothetical protein
LIEAKDVRLIKKPEDELPTRGRPPIDEMDDGVLHSADGG